MSATHDHLTPQDPGQRRPTPASHGHGRDYDGDDDDDISDASSSASFTSGENDIFSGLKESLVPVRVQKQAGITEVSFDGLLDPPLKLKEDLKEGCGGQLWPAGMVLARYMLRYHRETLRGKCILELGAGGGLVGLAVAHGCTIPPSTSPKLIITDQVPMYALMEENIALNGLESKVDAAIYDWGAGMPEDIQFKPSLPPPPPPLSSPRSTMDGTTNPADSANRFRNKRRPDVILAADCVYFEPAFPLLRDSLVALLSPATAIAPPSPFPSQQPTGSDDDPICYFCFKKRRKADWRFVKMIRKVLDVEEVTDDVLGREKERYGRDAVYLYRIRGKPETRDERKTKNQKTIKQPVML